MPGILGRLTPPKNFRLQGGTQIVHNGKKQYKLDSEEEGFLITEVELGNRSISNEDIKTYDGWLHPGSKFLRKIILPIDTYLGKRFYKNNISRIEKSKNCSNSLINFK